LAVLQTIIVLQHGLAHVREVANSPGSALNIFVIIINLPVNVKLQRHCGRSFYKFNQWPRLLQ
jgi:hypothetical protein